MDLQDYQEFTKTTANYNRSSELEYLALGLNGQAGQIATTVQKLAKQDCQYGEKFESRLKNELGDCLYYISQLTNLLGISFEDLAELNYRKLSIPKTKQVAHTNSIELPIKTQIEQDATLFWADDVEFVITEADRPD